MIKRFKYWLRGGEQINRMEHWRKQGFVPLTERDNILWGFLAIVVLTFTFPIWIPLMLISEAIENHRLYKAGWRRGRVR